jgi:hypothetical protein
MNMLSLTAILLAISVIAACRQDATGVARSPGGGAGAAVVQPHSQPETERGGMESDGGGGY